MSQGKNQNFRFFFSYYKKTKIYDKFLYVKLGPWFEKSSEYLLIYFNLNLSESFNQIKEALNFTF